MTETMLRTSAEKIALRHKTLHPQAIIKQIQYFAILNFCQGITKLKYTYQQNRHSYNLTCMLSSTLFRQQGPPRNPRDCIPNCYLVFHIRFVSPRSCLVSMRHLFHKTAASLGQGEKESNSCYFKYCTSD